MRPPHITTTFGPDPRVVALESLYCIYILRENRPYTFGKRAINLRYCKCDGKVTFTRPFLMLGKVTFDDHVNALEMYEKGDTS